MFNMPQKIPSLISKELCIIKFPKLCIIRADRAVHFINFFCKQNKRKINYKNIKEKNLSIHYYFISFFGTCQKISLSLFKFNTF